MKISKILAGVAATAIAATTSLTAFAGSGIIDKADGWKLDESGNFATRLLIGA